MFKKFIAPALVLAAVSAAAPAMAQDGAPFTGPRIAVTGGWDRVDHRGENGSGFVYGGTAGYDVAVGDVRLAPEIEATGTTQKACYSITGGRLCERANRDLYVGGRIGYVVAPSVLIYGKAGYTNARFAERAATTAVSFDNHDDRSGFRVGAGVEYAVNKQFFLTSEYRYSNYSDGFSRNQVIGGVGFRF